MRRTLSFLWPRSGWGRSLNYLRYRVMRMQGTPHSIAAGFAAGAAISFTPFIGIHFVLAALIAWLTRGNLVVSAIGTAVGNPWTFPLIFWWIYRLGSWALGMEPRGRLPEELTFEYLEASFHTVFVPMVVGGVPTALVAWAAFYFPLRGMVREYRRKRLRLRMKRLNILPKVGKRDAQ